MREVIRQEKGFLPKQEKILQSLAADRDELFRAPDELFHIKNRDELVVFMLNACLYSSWCNAQTEMTVMSILLIHYDEGCWNEQHNICIGCDAQQNDVQERVCGEERGER